jgi:hypothetical protein
MFGLKNIMNGGDEQTSKKSIVQVDPNKVQNVHRGDFIAIYSRERGKIIKADVAGIDSGRIAIRDGHGTEILDKSNFKKILEKRVDR